MNKLFRQIKSNPALLIGTAAVVGLALGTGAFPIPGLAGLRPAPKAAAAPAVPPPPPDPLNAY